MKKLLLFGFVLTLLATASQVAFTSSNSAPPVGNTNAPGNGNCTGCHGGSSLVTSGSLWNNINLTSTVPLGSFQPNTTYNMTLTYSDPSRTKYGFQLLVLPASANALSASVGTLTATNASVSVNTSGNRSYISHSNTGTSAPSNSRTWNFSWTTPAAFNGGVTFYVVVNSADGTGGSNGDVIYAKTFGATVLPVKWLYTKVNTTTNENIIEWATASEKNNSHFDIEKSDNLREWRSIGRIDGKGNSDEINHYKFSDEEKTAAYYRVKQTDFDGSFAYSSAVFAAVNDGIRELIYKPESKLIEVTGTHHSQTLQILKHNGTLVKTIIGEDKIDVADFIPGVYFIQTPSGAFEKIFIY
jgi:hypothetical protein